MCSYGGVVVVAHYMFYGRTLWYHSVTANHPRKRRVSKEMSTTSHMRHLHVKRGQYSKRMSVMSIITRYECCSVTSWYHILNTTKIVKIVRLHI